MKVRSILIALASAVLVVSVSACGRATDSQNQPFNDAPIDKSKGNSGLQDGPGVIVNMPDGFSNVAYKCVKNPDGSWTMFSTIYHKGSSYGALTVTSPAPLCGK